MNFIAHLEIGLVIAIIIIVQLVKSYIKLPIKSWDLIVIGLGFCSAFIVFGIKGLYSDFNIWLFFSTALIHAAGSILLYKTGKMGIIGIQNLFTKDPK